MARRAARASWADLALALPKARRSALDNKPFPLQLAKLNASPPAGKGWLHEIKWDGYRLGVTVVGGKARLWSRNGLDWSARVPSLARAIERLGLDEMALDGEMIAGRGTQADFNLLQATLAGGKAPKAGAVSLVVFDLLHLEGVDTSQAPLGQRKEPLAQLLTSPPAGLAYSSHVAGDGEEAFAAAAAAGFEGVISKKASAGYHGGRGEAWRKVKHLPSHEYAVVGWMPGQGSRGAGVYLCCWPRRTASTGGATSAVSALDSPTSCSGSSIAHSRAAASWIRRYTCPKARRRICARPNGSSRRS